MTLIEELKSLGARLEDDSEYVAGLIWGAAKAATGVAEKDLLASIPGAASKLKDIALQEVQSIENDPVLKGAVGDWKFGIAAARAWRLILEEVPVMESIGTSLLKGAIETAVQDGFAVMITML